MAVEGNVNVSGNDSVTTFNIQVWQQGLQAMAPGPLADRASIIIKLTQSNNAPGAVSISQAHGRGELVDYLIRQQKWGVVFILLNNDLAKWLPQVGEFDDLKWLLATLLDLKTKSKGQKADLILQTPSGPIVKPSSAYLKTLLDEAIHAAAQAWLRCLSGPGGEHRVWELPPVLQDRDLAQVIMAMLAAHPGHLALLLEDMPPQLEQTCLTALELLEFWQGGLQATDFCHDIILGAIKKINEGV